MKNGKFLVILYIFIFLVVLTGATFAYFTQNATGNEGAIAGKSAKVGVSLQIEPLYNDKDLVPMDDVDVEKAFKEYHCVDLNNYGACQAYTISIINEGQSAEYNGTIKFTLSGITNLNYMLFDEDDNVYVDITNIVTDTDQTLGGALNLLEDEAKTFKLVIWVPNFDYDQFEYDGGGSFDASVTYASVGNYHVTGSISGS